MAEAKIGILLGSESDYSVIEDAIKIIDKFEISYELEILSAHRNPAGVREYAQKAEERGLEVIIAAAGKAAHLPGVIASYTVLPVIGVPIKSDDLGGLDALLSVVQMPGGVPVATVAIDGTKNAALLAIQIMARSSKELLEKFRTYKENLAK